MSIIAGVYRPGINTPDRMDMVALEGVLQGSSSDGVLAQGMTSVTAAYAALKTTPESLNEIQPICQHNLLFVFDGRLDNREELMPLTNHECNRMTPDAELALAVYRTKGIDFVRHLIGEFAFVLWDAQAKLLLMGRDAFGVRPLAYYAGREFVAWSSDVKTLLAIIKISPTVSDEFVSNFLVWEPPPGSSPFREIEMIPPGNVVMFGPNGVQKRRYWMLDLSKGIRYRSSGEYVEHFKSLLEEGIRCRLRAKEPVTAELSGGLDSSSIVCVAQRMVEQRLCVAPSIATVSLIFDVSTTSDDSEYVRSVEEKLRLRGTHIVESEHRSLGSLDSRVCYWGPSDEILFDGALSGIRRAVKALNSRVLLCGEAGDHVLRAGMDPIGAADALLSLNIRKFFREFHDWGAASWPLGSLLWRGVIKPCLPRNVRPPSAPLPPWLDKRFAREWNLRESMLGPAYQGHVELNRTSAREAYSQFHQAVHCLSAGYVQQFFVSNCIDRSYPYLHRPLVEYVMAIPLEEHLQPRSRKALLRRAMEGTLPERLRVRKDQRTHNEVLVRGLSDQLDALERLFTNPIVVERGYVNPVALDQCLGKVRHGFIGDFAGPLVRLIMIEMWLRSLRYSRVDVSVTAGVKRPFSKARKEVQWIRRKSVRG